MTDLNAVQMVGRIVKGAELKKTQKGLSIANFTIVLNRDFKSGEEWKNKGTFVNLAVFGKIADSYAQYLQKGKFVGVEGHLDQNTWERDGKKISTLQVTVDKLYPFLEKKVKDVQEESNQLTLDESDFNIPDSFYMG